MEQWQGFKQDVWQREVNVRDYILTNYTEYLGNHTFLEGPTDAMKALWDQVMDLHELGEFISSLKNAKKVEVLPYHKLGVYKVKLTISGGFLHPPLMVS